MIDLSPEDLVAFILDLYGLFISGALMGDSSDTVMAAEPQPVDQAVSHFEMSPRAELTATRLFCSWILPFSSGEIMVNQLNAPLPRCQIDIQSLAGKIHYLCWWTSLFLDKSWVVDLSLLAFDQDSEQRYDIEALGRWVAGKLGARDNLPQQLQMKLKRIDIFEG